MATQLSLESWPMHNYVEVSNWGTITELTEQHIGFGVSNLNTPTIPISTTYFNLLYQTLQHFSTSAFKAHYLSSLVTHVLTGLLAASVSLASTTAGSSISTIPTTALPTVTGTCGNTPEVADCLTQCHAAIKAAEGCLTSGSLLFGGKFDETCLCETSKFAGTVLDCLGCTLGLWDTFSVFLDNPLGVCPDLPKTPTSALSCVSSSIASSSSASSSSATSSSSAATSSSATSSSSAATSSSASESSSVPSSSAASSSASSSALCSSFIFCFF
ncbi:unnamed protein product [Ambrosiozyma monospora]|uniref:Unnamed protein product n=1 Tax=Ambrosiozyma monospora TaxID=43982 RepID=A0A9W6Z2K7_AMBMO|nr:unnamed protein product [Ambrosiozyma monospora]